MAEYMEELMKKTAEKLKISIPIIKETKRAGSGSQPPLNKPIV